MAPDRQTIMETNRSLRTIKTELDNLLEKGIIDEEAYENMHSILPAETPLRGAPRANATPSQTSNPTSPPAPAAAAAAAADSFANLSLQNNNNNQRGSSPAPPPSYNQSTGSRQQQQQQQHAPPPGPPPPPSKPVLAHARALYRYHASDARDLSFDRDDKIEVHEYMNADWWMGRNTRTAAEGIFPKTYVAVEHTEPAPAPAPRQQPGYGAANKAPGYGSQQQLWPPQQGGAPAPHQYNPPGPPPQGYQQQQNPYNSDVPPMSVANQGSSTEQQNQQQQGADGQPQNGEEGKDGAGKAKEYGEKFGKKLGNAAIFGAGATLGGNLVNSIF